MFRIYLVLFTFFSVQSLTPVNGSDLPSPEEVSENSEAPTTGSSFEITPKKTSHIVSSGLEEEGFIFGDPTQNTHVITFSSNSGQEWKKIWFSNKKYPVISLTPPKDSRVISICIVTNKGVDPDTGEDVWKFDASVSLRERSENVENSLKDNGQKWIYSDQKAISIHSYEIKSSPVTDLEAFLSAFVGCGYFGQDVADSAVKR